MYSNGNGAWLITRIADIPRMEGVRVVSGTGSNCRSYSSASQRLRRFLVSDDEHSSRGGD